MHDRRTEPLTYFHRTGPIGQIFQVLVAGPNDRRPLAVLGLGTGTLASYALPGQPITFYEIDPAAIHIATEPKYFSYITDCRGKWNIVLGDGRLKLKEAEPGKYRIIVADAFTSDAIPVHLVTREAIQLYFDKLTDDGVLILNISNRYLSLSPVLANIAQDLGKVGLRRYDWKDNIPGKASSDWVVMARKPEHLKELASGLALSEREVQVNVLLGLLQTGASIPVMHGLYRDWTPLEPDPAKPLWTDDFSNLLSILR
jgi:spermidine synthase